MRAKNETTTVRRIHSTVKRSIQVCVFGRMQFIMTSTVEYKKEVVPGSLPPLASFRRSTTGAHPRLPTVTGGCRVQRLVSSVSWPCPYLGRLLEHHRHL